MTTMGQYQHKEAFALMWYACLCGHRERIWNSRNGVTPFGGVPCPSCRGRDAGYNGGLSHVDFHLDEPAPDHKLKNGQRFFRDGAADEAVDIVRRRLERFAESGNHVPADVRERLLNDARALTGEWRPGWPEISRFVDRSAEAQEDKNT